MIGLAHCRDVAQLAHHFIVQRVRAALRRPHPHGHGLNFAMVLSSILLDAFDVVYCVGLLPLALVQVSLRSLLTQPQQAVPLPSPALSVYVTHASLLCVCVVAFSLVAVDCSTPTW